MESNKEFSEYVKQAIRQARACYELGYILEADELMASIGYLPAQAGYVLSTYNKIKDES